MAHSKTNPNSIDQQGISSRAELEFAQIWVAKFPHIDLVTQLKPVPGRRFALDFAHPPSKTGIEINGGIWRKSAHSSGKGLLRDYEKTRLSALYGWLIVPLAPQQIGDETLDQIAQIIRDRSHEEYLSAMC